MYNTTSKCTVRHTLSISTRNLLFLVKLNFGGTVETIQTGKNLNFPFGSKTFCFIIVFIFKFNRFYFFFLLNSKLTFRKGIQPNFCWKYCRDPLDTTMYKAIQLVFVLHFFAMAKIDLARHLRLPCQLSSSSSARSPPACSSSTHTREEDRLWKYFFAVARYFRWFVVSPIDWNAITGMYGFVFLSFFLSLSLFRCSPSINWDITYATVVGAFLTGRTIRLRVRAPRGVILVRQLQTSTLVASMIGEW